MTRKKRRSSTWAAAEAVGLSRPRGGFTLIELLVVVAIISLLISILLPSLQAARSQARGVKCLANLRNHGQITMMYLSDNNEHYPYRVTTSSTGGGSVYGAFMPTRTILRTDRRVLEILTCPDDKEDVRDYALGDPEGDDQNGLGIADIYEKEDQFIVRYSYGLNNMTGIKPTTDAEKLLFNQKASAYPYPARTLMYADCAWVNARGHDKVINDSLKLKGRVANAGAPSRMNVSGEISDELARPQQAYARHRTGNNIVLWMDRGR